MALTIAVVVCACNEARPPCLYSLRAQTRPADQILVVNNASTDDTRATPAAVPGITVLDEPTKGLVVAREAVAEHRVPVNFYKVVTRRNSRGYTVVIASAP
jgi:glycosyltransferase involved in cell wall biosynthesis